MEVNLVKIRATGQETEWTNVGYAFLVSLEPQVDKRSQPAQESVGELLVAANAEGLTVIYERNKRSYELKINLLGDSPQFVQEDVTPVKKRW